MIKINRQFFFRLFIYAPKFLFCHDIWLYVCKIYTSTCRNMFFYLIKVERKFVTWDKIKQGKHFFQWEKYFNSCLRFHVWYFCVRVCVYASVFVCVNLDKPVLSYLSDLGYDQGFEKVRRNKMVERKEEKWKERRKKNSREGWRLKIPWSYIEFRSISPLQ